VKNVNYEASHCHSFQLVVDVNNDDCNYNNNNNNNNNTAVTFKDCNKKCKTIFLYFLHGWGLVKNVNYEASHCHSFQLVVDDNNDDCNYNNNNTAVTFKDCNKRKNMFVS
jgi:hypothetical protein